MANQSHRLGLYVFFFLLFFNCLLVVSNNDNDAEMTIISSRNRT